MSDDNKPAVLPGDENAAAPSDEVVVAEPVDALDRLAMLELDNVSLSYHAKKKSFDHGTHHVLNQVSLQLYEGETLGIIGRNGVGKTTLLRLMAGILAPTLGKVHLIMMHTLLMIAGEDWLELSSQSIMQIL